MHSFFFCELQPSFTFNSKFLYELNHKAYFKIKCVGFFIFDSVLFLSKFILYYTTPYYTILYYNMLCYTILYYTILYYTIPYYTILHCTILYCSILYYTILQYIFRFLTNLRLKIKKSKKAGSQQKTSFFYRQAPRIFIFQILSVDQ